MRASIISVGSEILRGTLLDTNSNYFARELQAIGVEVVRATQVADDLEALVEVFRASLKSSGLVIVSGGLGPTEDDLTREAILKLTGETPVVDEAIVQEIRERFQLRGSEMPRRNEKQAWTIPSARIIRNDHGTAPGWIVELPDAMIVTLPGPPRENRPMWRDLVRPLLLPRVTSQSIVSRTIKTIGIGESSVADRLEDLIEAGWPDVATFAKSDGVHVTITASHSDRALADAAVRAASDAAIEILNDHVYGLGDDSLAAAITQPLTAAGIQFSVWEAGTAGALTSMLLSDGQAQESVAEARLWAAPDRYAQSRSFNIRQFALDATTGAGCGTAAAVAAHISSENAALSDGLVEVALAHAGDIIDASQQIRGTADEVRRRSALFAAEFLWSQIRDAAGVRPVAGISNPSSRTGPNDQS
ncbi:hypothetical protein BH23CHL2_BH23CHL2_15040 [soil metagenome]